MPAAIHRQKQQDQLLNLNKLIKSKISSLKHLLIGIFKSLIRWGQDTSQIITALSLKVNIKLIIKKSNIKISSRIINNYNTTIISNIQTNLKKIRMIATGSIMDHKALKEIIRIIIIMDRNHHNLDQDQNTIITMKPNNNSINSKQYHQLMKF